MDSQRWTSTSDRYLTPGTGDTWAAEAEQSGQRGSQRILDVATTPAPEAVSTALGLNPHDQVVVRRRLILADDTPVEIAESYWPAEIASNTPLAGAAKIPGGAVALLAKLGYQPAITREQVDVSLAGSALSPDDRHEMRIAPTAAVLVLQRTVYDNDGAPYEHSIMTRRPGLPLVYTRRGA
ncbi:GntR family transcriptional regulator [Plantactinospora sp. WMMB334]|uniref:GntR family transcriptional regulator n=1 Tax=Plantactinospora sp. WMMB334 TaxID=3404119 RepID=UPI003B92692B